MMFPIYSITNWWWSFGTRRSGGLNNGINTFSFNDLEGHRTLVGSIKSSSNWRIVRGHVTSFPETSNLTMESMAVKITVLRILVNDVVWTYIFTLTEVCYWVYLCIKSFSHVIYNLFNDNGLFLVSEFKILVKTLC